MGSVSGTLSREDFAGPGCTPALLCPISLLLLLLHKGLLLHNLAPQ